MPDPKLEIRDLEVRFGPLRAVRGVGLEVETGEIVGLIGPNGAGKSTTLLAVMGAVSIHGGSVLVDGKSERGRRTVDIARSGVALVPEGRHIFPDLTVAENLQLGLAGRRKGASDYDAQLDWVNELFPVVADFRRRKAGALSGGQQQQLAIARALLADPTLLLLDEPSLGLSPSVVSTVWDVLREIRDRGVTILLVEQRAQITIALASRTYVMNSGEIRTVLKPEDADRTDLITDAYFGAAA